MYTRVVSYNISFITLNFLTVIYWFGLVNMMVQNSVFDWVYWNKAWCESLFRCPYWRVFLWEIGQKDPIQNHQCRAAGAVYAGCCEGIWARNSIWFVLFWFCFVCFWLFLIRKHTEKAKSYFVKIKWLHIS